MLTKIVEFNKRISSCAECTLHWLFFVPHLLKWFISYYSPCARNHHIVSALIFSRGNIPHFLISWVTSFHPPFSPSYLYLHFSLLLISVRTVRTVLHRACSPGKSLWGLWDDTALKKIIVIRESSIGQYSAGLNRIEWCVVLYPCMWI